MASPPIVELVGPAGVGKTTLTQVLSRRRRAVLPVPLPNYRSISQVPFFVRNTFLSLPSFVELAGHRRLGWPSRREMAWMVILQGWPSALRQQSSQGEAILLLDQGPVFLLAVLDAFGPGVLASREAQNWWARMYRQCSAALDIVFLLDAPNGVCAERIRGREQWHIVKNAPDETIFEFQARFRQEYERVIARLTGGGAGPRVVCLNTAVHSPDEIADRILVACGFEDDRGETEY